jgi:hypothetical protein
MQDETLTAFRAMQNVYAHFNALDHLEWNDWLTEHFRLSDIANAMIKDDLHSKSTTSDSHAPKQNILLESLEIAFLREEAERNQANINDEINIDCHNQVSEQLNSNSINYPNERVAD